ncbi:hypothetical protein VTN02DRAFT_6048 [Thermoascus thermophilus]
MTYAVPFKVFRSVVYLVDFRLMMTLPLIDPRVRGFCLLACANERMSAPLTYVEAGTEEKLVAWGDFQA